MPSRFFDRIVTVTAMLCIASLQAQSPLTSTMAADRMRIPRGRAVNLDGILSPGEWDHAARAQITVAGDWVVTVLAQHDGKNLYVAFTELKHAGQERYPEVLLDPADEKTVFWRPGQWWLHASYNLCESEGQPNDYSSCRPGQQGWNATRFPLKEASEFAISLDKIHLQAGKPFGLAFDVTDTHKEWSYWPATAKIKFPMSWQRAELQ
jgi:hypothetical protein